jgi:predicted NAD/FAD-dependent oxidoreductase
VTIAIVGGGVSGLSCARALGEAGRDVVVFDKGRRPGGRLATRETEAGAFEHGAQFFTVRDPSFAGEIDRRRDEGAVAEWKARIAYVGPGSISPARPSRRFVGVPSMAALAGAWAEGLDVRRLPIGRVSPEGSGWVVHSPDGSSLGPYDHLVLALPAPQALPLLPAESSLVRGLARDRFEVCLAGMFDFPSELAVPWDAAFVDGHPLTWLARESSRPGRAPGDRWIVHAGHEWSASRAERPEHERAEELLAALADLLGRRPPEPVFARTHAWRAARPSDPRRDGSVLDPETGVVVCGDWCAGARVEGAWTSGRHAAARILGP